MAPGTEIIFQYLVPPAMLDDQSRQIRDLFAIVNAARGEPYLTFFEPAKLAEQLREVGFTEVRDFGPDDANARYFANRTDGLHITAEHHFMGAQV